jgi:hypothetical protein
MFFWDGGITPAGQTSGKLITNKGGQALAGGDKFRHIFLVIEGTNFGRILSKTD